MIRQRGPNKRADQTLLTFFILRNGFGIAVFGWLTAQALQLTDTRLGWIFLCFTLIYASYTLSVVVRGFQKLRKRYGGKA